MSRLARLQSLRALAAMMVLIGHVLAETAHYRGVSTLLTALPWAAGVDIFFVVSGFIVTLSARRFEGDPAGFLRRRLWRVVPLYYLFTTLMVAVLVLLPDATKETTLALPQIVASYGFVPWPRPDGRLAPVLSLGWTLNYEMFFYALFGLCLLTRRPVGMMAVLLAGLAAVGASGWMTAPPLAFWTSPLILEFAFGIGLAALWQTGWRARRGALVLLAAGLALLVALEALVLPRFLAAGLPATLIVAAAVLFEPRGRWPGARLGDASYALYLSHRFTLRALTLLVLPLMPAGPLGFWAYVAIACLAATAVALGVYRWIELPILRLGAGRPGTGAVLTGTRP